MAGPFDALFTPVKKEPIQRPRRTKGGVCLECDTPGVFWAYHGATRGYTLCEVVDGRVVRHQHRAKASDFEQL